LPLYWRGWSIKILWPTMSLVTQRILSIGKKNYFSKHVNGLITNFSTIRPHSSLPSSPPNQFIINGIGRSEKIIDGELQKKKMIDFIIKSTLSCPYWLYITFCLKENTSVQ
jgi:hypothetical protein